MSQKTYTILGSTGHIGHQVAEELLKRGHYVKAVGRDARKLLQLQQKGAVPCQLELTDCEGLTEACQDSYAVFTILPPAMDVDNHLDYHNQVGSCIAEALQKAGVKRVVNLSSVGAEYEEGTGLIKSLYNQEKRLDQLKNLNYLIHIRADYFMENLNFYLPMLAHGVIRDCLAGDLPIPMVATRDIGWKAADFLDSTIPQQHEVFDFVGPKEVTLNHAAKLLGHVFDIPDLHYEQIAYEDAKRMLVESGMKPECAELYVEMGKGFNEGLIKPTQGLSREHRGMTTLETYVEMIAHTSLAKAA